MQSTKIKIGDVRVNLRKKPYEPIILAKINDNRVEVSIADNVIEIVTGHVDPQILPKLKKLITQYFLPVIGPKIQKRKPIMHISTKEILQEFQKQNIDEKYIAEGIQIVQDRMILKQCSLEEAVKFVVSWILRNEQP